MKSKNEMTGWKEISGIALLGLALFLFLSLISYSPRDIGFLYSSANHPPQNYIGILGAWIGFLLFISIGAAAYLAPLLIDSFGVSFFISKEENRLSIRIPAALVFLISSALIFHMQHFLSHDAFTRSHNVTSLGGVLGEKISEVFLIPYMGTKGSSIVVITAFTASFLLLCQKGVIHFLNFLWMGILWSIDWVKTTLESRQKNKVILQPVKTRRIRKAVALENEEEDDEDKEEDEDDEEEDEEKVLPARRQPPKINLVETKPLQKSQATVIAHRSSVPTTGAFVNYRLPPLDLLDDPPQQKKKITEEDLETNSQLLESTLRDFGIDAQVIEVTRGPVITRYELQLAPGIKVQKITNLQDDIALAMRAASLRILAPIPGKAAVGIEVPNSHITPVVLKELLLASEFQNFKGNIPLVLGKDVSGKTIVTDLTTMPHLLIAGATGSGKSVCVNSIIINMLFYASPSDIQFLLVDPKMVEMTGYNKLPHLISPVLTDPKKVPMGLAWVVNEMEKRYSVFARVGVRNIQGYNTLPSKQKENPDTEGDLFPEKYPYIVVIIDELADLMMIAPAEVENAITRLAQLSRAVGIHLILATQRPSVDVITGIIKANFPARIAFQVSSKVDSRTILDANGAEKLLGRGDLLFLPPGSSKLIRTQGAWVRDQEINRILDFIQAQGLSGGNTDIFEEVRQQSGIDPTQEDELYEEALRVVTETQQASVSIIQRRLRVGYTRAARLMDLLEVNGIVGPYKGSKARDILVEDLVDE